MSRVTRVVEFPEWDAQIAASLGPEWVPWGAGRWLLPLDEAILPGMVTPWVRMVDYSLPGFVETEVPEGWGARIVQWEQSLLRAAMRSAPAGASGWPRTASDWKRAIRSWCRPSTHADRWNGVWQVDTLPPVYVGPDRVPASAEEALVVGQWIKLKVALRGVVWDGQTLSLAFVADQLLVRQPWREDVQEMAARAMETARSAWLIGPQEEKILSLLDILST